MDGTLIDSNGIWKDVDIAFLKKRGFAYTRAYYEGVAHTIFPLAAKFTKEYCHLSESAEEIMAEWMEMAGDAYATRVPVKPGVQAYLDRCRAAGERMIVLTSSVPAHCRAALGHLGLLPYFETIIFAHDLGIEKKNPEIYHLAARARERVYDVRRLGRGAARGKERRDAHRRRRRPVLRAGAGRAACRLRPVYREL